MLFSWLQNTPTESLAEGKTRRLKKEMSSVLVITKWKKSKNYLKNQPQKYVNMKAQWTQFPKIQA